VRQADVLGEDERLVSVLHQRLAELEVSTLDAGLGVLVVAIVSSQAAATAQVARKLTAGTQWAGATTAFATGSGPSLSEAANRLRHRGARRGDRTVVLDARTTD
jgi:sirohydrochlorin ferrochelatase